MSCALAPVQVMSRWVISDEIMVGERNWLKAKSHVPGKLLVGTGAEDVGSGWLCDTRGGGEEGNGEGVGVGVEGDKGSDDVCAALVGKATLGTETETGRDGTTSGTETPADTPTEGNWRLPNSSCTIDRTFSAVSGSASCSACSAARSPPSNF